MKKEKQISRNGTISLLKFIFSITIVLYHTGKIIAGVDRFKIASIGYISVDFFFIVSGYYFYKSIIKMSKTSDIYKENVKTTISKLLKFLPYTIIAWLIGSIVLYINHEIGISEAILGVFNTFLLDMSGLTGYTLNGPLWYLSAMLILFFVLTPIVYKYKDRYSKYISPIIVVFGLGYLYHQSEHLNIFLTVWNGILYGGLIRALVDINLGIIVYEITTYLKEWLKDKKIKIIILNIIQFILYAFVFAYIYFYTHEGKADYIVLFIIATATITSFTDEYISKKLDCPLTRYCEKLSLPMFINHFIIIDFINIASKKNTLFINNLILCVIATILFSAVEMFVIDKVTRKLKAHK